MPSSGACSRSNPQSAGTWNNLGVLELSAGRLEAAAEAFRQAVAADPSYGDAWQGLGAALADRDRAAAVEAWRRAERLLPRDYDLLFNLAMALADWRARGRGPAVRRIGSWPRRHRRAMPADLAQMRSVRARLRR